MDKPRLVRALIDGLGSLANCSGQLQGDYLLLQPELLIFGEYDSKSYLGLHVQGHDSSSTRSILFQSASYE